MKKNSLIVLITAIVFSSCWYNRNNVSVSIKEDEDEYSLQAKYNPAKTQNVQRYIQSQLEPNKIFNNTNGMVDVTAVLDDDTKLYIKSNRGSLKIKFDKEENSEEAYYRVKEMCEEIKDIIAH